MCRTTRETLPALAGIHSICCAARHSAGIVIWYPFRPAARSKIGPWSPHLVPSISVVFFIKREETVGWSKAAENYDISISDTFLSNSVHVVFQPGWCLPPMTLTVPACKHSYCQATRHALRKALVRTLSLTRLVASAVAITHVRQPRSVLWNSRRVGQAAK